MDEIANFQHSLRPHAGEDLRCTFPVHASQRRSQSTYHIRQYDNETSTHQHWCTRPDSLAHCGPLPDSAPPLHHHEDSRNRQRDSLAIPSQQLQPTNDQQQSKKHKSILYSRTPSVCIQERIRQAPHHEDV